MTSSRAKTYAKYYDEGVLLSSETPDKEHYKTVSKSIRSAMVSARKVLSAADLAPWAQHCGSIYKPDKDGQYWDLDCSCAEFSHSNNRCPCVVYMAQQKGFIDLEVLLNGCKPRKTAGRPRKDKGWADTSSGTAMRRTAAQWLDYILKDDALRLWHHMVLADVGDEKLPGFVKTAKVEEVDAINRQYIIAFPDGQPDVTMTTSQLAEAIFMAREFGLPAQYAPSS